MKPNIKYQCTECGTQLEDTQTMIPCEECKCHQPEPKNWKEDLKQLSYQLSCDRHGDGISATYRFGQISFQDKMENFITNLLKEHDTKLIEAVGELELPNKERVNYHRINGYNNALQDAVNIIKGV